MVAGAEAEAEAEGMEAKLDVKVVAEAVMKGVEVKLGSFDVLPSTVMVEVVAEVAKPDVVSVVMLVVELNFDSFAIEAIGLVDLVA